MTPRLTLSAIRAYAFHAVPHWAAGRGNPRLQLVRKRQSENVGAFFVPYVFLIYGGRARAAFGLAGVQLSRFSTPRIVRRPSQWKESATASIYSTGACHV